MAKRNNKKEPFPVVIVTYGLIFLFSAFSLFFVVNQGVMFFKNSELFVIKEIVKDPSLPPLDAEFLDRLKGRSIFSVDLRMVEQRLQGQNPQVDQLRVLRKFPDRIYVVAKAREPFALVLFHGREVVVDEEGFALNGKTVASSPLPLIVGLNPAHGVIPGRQVESSEMRVALDILKRYQANPHLNAYEVVSIDVTNLSKMMFTLAGDLKIIFDPDQVTQKLQTLEFILTEGNLKREEIAYIDLRFKEPVLGKKGTPQALSPAGTNKKR